MDELVQRSARYVSACRRSASLHDVVIQPAATEENVSLPQIQLGSDLEKTKMQKYWPNAGGERKKFDAHGATRLGRGLDCTGLSTLRNGDLRKHSGHKHRRSGECEPKHGGEADHDDDVLEWGEKLHQEGSGRVFIMLPSARHPPQEHNVAARSAKLTMRASARFSGMKKRALITFLSVYL